MISREGLWERSFGAAVELCVRRPRTVLALGALLAAASVGLAAARLEVRTSNLDLVDPSLPEVARFRAFAERFGTPNMLVVVLEGADPAKLHTAVDRVAEEARKGPGVRNVLARLPYNPQLLAFGGVPAYFASKDGGMCFVFVQPDDPRSSAATIDPFVRGVREALARSGLPALGVKAGLTGLPQYALDDRDVIKRDISALSTISFVVCLALFVAAFGRFVRPILAMALLAVASAWVVGVVAIAPGHLTLLSAFFFSALFGLGSDYGIFVIDGMEEALAEGAGKSEAVVRAVRFLAPGLATEGLTTAFAFLTLTVSGFRGFAELGAIGFVGIALSLFAMVTLLPAALVLVPDRGRRREKRLEQRRLGRLLAALQRPWLAWGLAVASVGGLLLGLPAFDGDYLSLQPRNSEAVRLEREMVKRSALSPQFAAVVTDSPARAGEIAARLRKLGTVGAVRSIADLRALDAVAGPEPAARQAFGASFESADGRYAVYAYPSGDVWDPEFEARFLADVRSVDREATGMPVLGRFMIDLSRRALAVTGILSSIVVLLIVWIQFRSPRFTLLAIAPTVLGVAAMVGAMKALGLDFNPINVMALPVVIGTAVDSGVHITHRFIAERGDLFRTLAGSGRTVLVSALTTIAGFGALAFTSHRGLASFAIALTLGVATSLVLSLFVLPELLMVFGRPAVSEAPVEATGEAVA